MRALQTISPLATLERGYAIVTDSSAHILRDADAVQPGDRVSARLARGRLHCAVEEIDLDPQDQKV
jgi:exodeoxyribonuclease VII large subunit